MEKPNESDTELRLGLPGQEDPCKIISRAKRVFSDVGWGLNDGSEKISGGLDGTKKVENLAQKVGQDEKKSVGKCENAPVAKAQVVGWPPIRSFRKNNMATNLSKNVEAAEGKTGCGGCLYVKVSMDGAPYLRKVDLKTCKNYVELSKALEKMFNSVTLGQCTSKGLRGEERLKESNLKELLKRDECVLTYEDKDGDWMLVGDVPWEMFVDSCKRLRIMKGSEAIGLAPRSMEKCKNQV
ncbi:PB1 domain, AUX/IAA protein [Artemisia annua]|uniref:Auxin-responsive protein n=1 Tax=Artemisia annua TaxID=35608 RepID=A0A2U1NGH7_ARTAN|nr:PB1 domain, AUX/IAA protein [Artemisia annua]